jgi:hypothetical protein
MADFPKMLLKLGLSNEYEPIMTRNTEESVGQWG